MVSREVRAVRAGMARTWSEQESKECQDAVGSDLERRRCVAGTRAVTSLQLPEHNTATRWTTQWPGLDEGTRPEYGTRGISHPRSGRVPAGAPPTIRSAAGGPGGRWGSVVLGWRALRPPRVVQNRLHNGTLKGVGNSSGAGNLSHAVWTA
eukprot:scaffold27786_cov69-Phaeocystis_antarctica.AAC.2